MEDVERTVRVVQARLRELDREVRDSLHSPRYAAGACAVDGAMIALTATPWRTGQETLPAWNTADAKVYAAFAVLAVLTVVGVLISHAGEAANSFGVSEYQYLAGRWLTLFAAFGLAFLHGGRAAELRSTK